MSCKISNHGIPSCAWPDGRKEMPRAITLWREPGTLTLGAWFSLIGNCCSHSLIWEPSGLRSLQRETHFCNNRQSLPSFSPHYWIYFVVTLCKGLVIKDRKWTNMVDIKSTWRLRDGKCQPFPKKSLDNRLQDCAAFMRKVEKTISLGACHRKEEKGPGGRINVSKKHKRWIDGKDLGDHCRGNRWKKSGCLKTK